VAASHHGDTPYSGNSVTSVPVTPYTTSVDVNQGCYASFAVSAGRYSANCGCWHAPALSAHLCALAVGE
jgi:hypothetical protein